MTDYALIVLSAALVNNFVLVRFLGLCPFVGVSTRPATALGMGLATTFVLTVSAVAAHLIDAYLLAPWQLDYLRTVAFIFAIACVVQFTELLLQATSPLLHRVLGIYLPLITTNCAVLGVALLSVQADYDFTGTALYGLGTALGFTLVLWLLAGLRERIDTGDVPAPFQGAPIALITAGLMALAFMGFSGFFGV
ncbi:MAG: electron transport complex subunit RsxA [Candidatus Competibacterales bacterium]